MKIGGAKLGGITGESALPMSLRLRLRLRMSLSLDACLGLCLGLHLNLGLSLLASSHGQENPVLHRRQVVRIALHQQPAIAVIIVVVAVIFPPFDFVWV